MEQERLKIGRIPFANLFPIFHELDRGHRSPAYEFVDGVPSLVNRLLRRGEIDISPSSSVEYLRQEDLYGIVEGHSISSFGPIGSILLFSLLPIEKLHGQTVLTSSQSETSVALLEIVLRKFYGMECLLTSSHQPLSEGLKDHPAYLLIGDEALREAQKKPAPYRYDLGGIWHERTGLPFVFALWIFRKEALSRKRGMLERFRNELDAAKAEALRNLTSIAGASPMIAFMTEEQILSYWQGISYDFTEVHRKGLALFRRHAEELGLLAST